MKRWLIAGALFLSGCAAPFSVSPNNFYITDGPREYTLTVSCEDEHEPVLAVNKNNRTKAVISCEEIK